MSARIPETPEIGPATLKWTMGITRIFNFLFRVEYRGVEKIDPDKPAILAINHNAAFWGILDVLLVTFLWWRVQKKPPGILAGYGEEAVFKIPVLGTFFRNLGGVAARIPALRKNLQEGHWALFAPGANVDLLRPVRLRHRPRFKRAVWTKSKIHFAENVGYLDAARQAGAPVYPVSISGTSEITPILWESPRLLRWTGMRWLRKDENWPGFPITLNHFINLAIFLATPLRESWIAWIVFVLANIYVDLVYFYPVFPFKVKVDVLDPVTIPEDVGGGSIVGRTKALGEINRDLENRITRAHGEQDRNRPWLKLFRRRKA
jgi:1-acyl-sn-glycerol-3-phosphate acyltransferase